MDFDNYTIEELHQMIDDEITRQQVIDWNKIPDSLRKEKKDKDDPLYGGRGTLICDCGTQSHAHHINCPQHPCNKGGE